MYRQSHRKIRLWLGEDYQFSTVIRTSSGATADLSGATAKLLMSQYSGGGSNFSADLDVGASGALSAQLNGAEMYRQMMPGLYRYVVLVTNDSAALVAESGTVQAIGGHSALTSGDFIELQSDGYIELE